MATKEQLRRLRMKYHLGEFRTSISRKSSGTKRRSRRSNGERMARRRRSSSRGGFGMNKLLMGAAVGAGVALFLKQDLVKGALGGAAGGALIGKGLIGPAVGAFAAPMVLGGVSSVANNENW